MKTIILLVLLSAAGRSFFSAAFGQVYDYKSDSVILVQPAMKVYPSVIMSPDDFRALQNKKRDAIPVSRQPSTLRVDSTSAHFRMMERIQRLPGIKRWDNDAVPGTRSKTGGEYFRRRPE